MTRVPETFQVLKIMLLKYCTQYANKFGKFSSGHGTGKGQFSFQSQRKAMPKNVQITIQLHSFQRIARLCSKSSGLASAVCELRTSRCTSWIQKRQKNILLTYARSYKKQENSPKIYFCFIDYAKAFDCVDHNKLQKILQEMRIPYHLICLLRNLNAG